jgi:hypothetical protein
VACVADSAPQRSEGVVAGEEVVPDQLATGVSGSEKRCARGKRGRALNERGEQSGTCASARIGRWEVGEKRWDGSARRGT